MKVESVNGKNASLIYCGDGQYRIRIYESSSDGLKMFKDYDIRHCDLWFKIDDEDAYSYEDENDVWIDHSPRTLGLKDLETKK